MKEFSQKTVLITGATGLIGSHLVDALMAMGDVRVIALSRNEQKLKEGFKEYNKKDRFSYVVADVMEDFSLDNNGAIDYIFHAASPMERKIIDQNPVGVIIPNLHGTINCIKLLLRQKEMIGKEGRLVLFSSVSVYANNSDKETSVFESETNITESLDSLNAPYSQSKRMSEVIVQAYRRQYGLNVVIARLSTVYGNTRYRPDTAFYQFIEKALIKENIVMKVSGIGRRDNIYIDDAIEGLLKICAFGENGQAYNISSNGERGNFAAIDEIGQMIAGDINKRYGYLKENQILVEYQDGGENIRKAGLKLDNSKLKQLNWKVKTSLAEGIHQTISLILDELENEGFEDDKNK